MSPVGTGAGAAGRAASPRSTSSATMRPSGPVPRSDARSMPRSRAMRRASGEALMRPPFDALALGAGSAASSHVRRCLATLFALGVALVRFAASRRLRHAGVARSLADLLALLADVRDRLPDRRLALAAARSSAARRRSRTRPPASPCRCRSRRAARPSRPCRPRYFSHFVIVPASMPWPSRGSLTSDRHGYFPTVRLIAASTSSACGTTNCSITGANASGANFAPTRSIGASR